MKNSELKEYLNTFSDDSDISFILANSRERKLYECVNILLVTDMGQPILCIDVGNESDMDSDVVAVCEECERNADNLSGQMEITDFPEVMP